MHRPQHTPIQPLLYTFFLLTFSLLPLHAHAAPQKMALLFQQLQPKTPLQRKIRYLLSKNLSKTKLFQLISPYQLNKILPTLSPPPHQCTHTPCLRRWKKQLQVDALLLAFFPPKHTKTPLKLRFVWLHHHTTQQWTLTSTSKEPLALFAQRIALTLLLHTHSPQQCTRLLTLSRKLHRNIQRRCWATRSTQLCLPFRKFRNKLSIQKHLFANPPPKKRPSYNRRRTRHTKRTRRTKPQPKQLHPPLPLHPLHDFSLSTLKAILQQCPKLATPQLRRLKFQYLHTLLVHRQLTRARLAVLQFVLQAPHTPHSLQLSRWFSFPASPSTSAPWPHTLLHTPITPPDNNPQPETLRSVKLLQQHGHFTAAIHLAHSWLKRHPRHKHTPLAMWRLAQAYEHTAQHKQARKTYLLLLKQAPRWKKTDQLLYKAAQISAHLKEFPAAIRFYRRLTDQPSFSRSPYKTKAMIKLAELYKQRNQHEKAAQLYLNIFHKTHRSTPAASTALYRAAVLFKQGNNIPKARQLFQSFLGTYQYDLKQVRRIIHAHIEVVHDALKRTRSVRRGKRLYKVLFRSYSDRSHLLTPREHLLLHPHVSKAVYGLAMIYFREFLTLKVDSQELKVQRRQLSAKVQKYETIQKQLAKLPPGPMNTWHLCAEAHLARGKLILAQTIGKMPLPIIEDEKWTPKSRQLYKKKIKLLYTFPLTQQSIALYSTLLQKAGHKKDPCIQKARRELKRLLPHLPLPIPQQKHSPKTPHTKPQTPKLPSTKYPHTHPPDHRPRTTPPYLKLKVSCARGELLSCSHLGLLYESRGTLGTKKARKYYDIACILGHGKSCFFLARMHRQGKGGPKNLRQSLALHLRGCKASFTRSCTTLAKHWAQKIPHSNNALLPTWTFLYHACQLKDPRSCTQIAQLSLRTQQLITPLRFAQTQLQRACALGHRPSCTPPKQRTQITPDLPGLIHIKNSTSFQLTPSSQKIPTPQARKQRSEKQRKAAKRKAAKRRRTPKARHTLRELQSPTPKARKR